MRRFFQPFWEVLEVFVAALLSIVIIYSFIAQPFLVKGASMEPNFSDDDFLLVDEITYRFRPPSRGEVIVFRNPRNEAEFYIKRIVGLPHDEIRVAENTVLVNGEPLEESYLPQGLQTTGEYTFNLESDQYFVLGDNRRQSFDSRSWGPLQRDGIIGAVRLRFWPPIKFEVFARER